MYSRKNIFAVFLGAFIIFSLSLIIVLIIRPNRVKENKYNAPCIPKKIDSISEPYAYHWYNPLNKTVEDNKSIKEVKENDILPLETIRIPGSEDNIFKSLIGTIKTKSDKLVKKFTVILVTPDGEKEWQETFENQKEFYIPEFGPLPKRKKLSLGSKLLIIYPEDEDLAFFYINISIEEKRTVYVDITLEESKKIKGVVVDSLGNPVENAIVEILENIYFYSVNFKPEFRGHLGTGVIFGVGSDEKTVINTTGKIEHRTKTKSDGSFSKRCLGNLPVEIKVKYLRPSKTEYQQIAYQMVIPGAENLRIITTNFIR